MIGNDHLKISQNGINLIKHFEGGKNKAYLDSVGAPTIGYGHTSSVTFADVENGRSLSEKQIDVLFQTDLETHSNHIRKHVKQPLNQHQFDALVSFSYNLGEDTLKRSSLLRKINQGDFEGASLEFSRWNKAKGVTLSGLTRRRNSESELFKNGQLNLFEDAPPPPKFKVEDFLNDPLADREAILNPLKAAMPDVPWSDLVSSGFNEAQTHGYWGQRLITDRKEQAEADISRALGKPFSFNVLSPTEFSALGIGDALEFDSFTGDAFNHSARSPDDPFFRYNGNYDLYASETFTQAINKLKEENPNVKLPFNSYSELLALAGEQAKEIRDEYAENMERTGWFGKTAGVVSGMAGALTDPVNIGLTVATAPFGGSGLAGLLTRFGINFGTDLAFYQPIAQQVEADLGFESGFGNAVMQSAIGATAGAGLEVAVKGIGKTIQWGAPLAKNTIKAARDQLASLRGLDLPESADSAIQATINSLDNSLFELSKNPFGNSYASLAEFEANLTKAAIQFDTEGVVNVSKFVNPLPLKTETSSLLEVLGQQSNLPPAIAKASQEAHAAWNGLKKSMEVAPDKNTQIDLNFSKQPAQIEKDLVSYNEKAQSSLSYGEKVALRNQASYNQEIERQLARKSEANYEKILWETDRNGIVEELTPDVFHQRINQEKTFLEQLRNCMLGT